MEMFSYDSLAEIQNVLIPNVSLGFYRSTSLLGDVFADKKN